MRVSIIFYGNFLAFFEIVRSIALQIYLTGVNKMDIEELEFTDPVVDSEQLTVTISTDNIKRTHQRISLNYGIGCRF